MQQRELDISVVIPAYNEAEAIGRVMTQTVAVMNQLNLTYEIIVVDDGSTDTTKEIASTHNAKVISDGKNHGKGYSVRRAFQQVQGNIIVTIDADGEHKPEEIPKLIYPLNNGTDVVAGSRFLGNGKDFTTRLNVIGNKFLNFTIMTLTGKYITDSQTGFRAFKRAFLDQVNLESDGYEIEAEITVKSLRNGFKLEEIPISCQRRESGKSKLKIAFDGFKMLKTILRSSFTPIIHESNNHHARYALENRDFIYN
jgi:glycosyltransferase involved in cell wall biosynthesis